MPYIDETSRCDHIALVRSGECLFTDTPVDTRTSFDRRLYVVRCASMYKLLGDLRGFPDINPYFTFGDTHHLTLRRNGGDVMRRLQKYLKGRGYADVNVERLEPNVESCFIASQERGCVTFLWDSTSRQMRSRILEKYGTYIRHRVESWRSAAL